MPFCISTLVTVVVPFHLLLSSCITCPAWCLCCKCTGIPVQKSHQHSSQSCGLWMYGFSFCRWMGVSVIYHDNSNARKYYISAYYHLWRSEIKTLSSDSLCCGSNCGLRIRWCLACSSCSSTHIMHWHLHSHLLLCMCFILTLAPCIKLYAIASYHFFHLHTQGMYFFTTTKWTTSAI